MLGPATSTLPDRCNYWVSILHIQPLYFVPCSGVFCNFDLLCFRLYACSALRPPSLWTCSPRLLRWPRSGFSLLDCSPRLNSSPSRTLPIWTIQALPQIQPSKNKLSLVWTITFLLPCPCLHLGSQFRWHITPPGSFFTLTALILFSFSSHSGQVFAEKRF